MKSIALILILLAGTAVEARVFKFKDEFLASFLRGSAGLSLIGDSAIKGAVGDSTTMGTDDKVTYNFSGEFGFLYTIEGKVVFRVGAELLQAKPLNDRMGRDSNGDELFTMSSKVFVFNPNITVEYSIITDNIFRVFGFLGIGYAQVSMDNVFTMSALGTTTYGKTNFDEKAQANLISHQYGFGAEVLFVDNVTAFFDVGIRAVKFNELTHKNSTDTIAQGAVNAGDVLKNLDGTTRSLDMSGFFVSGGLRFYIDIL